MKSTDLSFVPSDMAAAAARSGAASSATVNMRRSSDPLLPALVPAGVPLSLAATSMRPLCRYAHPLHGDILLLSSGTALAALRLADCPGASPVPIGMLESLPSSAVVAGTDIIVMTATGSEFIEVAPDGSMTLIGPMPCFPSLSLTAGPCMTLSSTVDAFTLSGSYNSRSGHLSRADSATLTSRLLDAYTDLCCKATAAGLSPQPVLARYRLLGADGQLLYVSPLTILSAPDGFQCVGELAIHSADNLATTSQSSLAAECFRPCIKAPAIMNGRWYQRVAWVEIDCSRPLHPVDFSLRAADALDITSSGTHIRCFVPGTSAGMAPAPIVRERITRSAVTHAGQLLSTVARIAAPFTGGLGAEGSVTYLPVPAETPSVDIAATRRTCTATQTPRDLSLIRCAPPHRFSASAALSASGITLYADPVINFFDGYPLQSFAHSVTSGSWEASVTVTLADGSVRVVSSSSGSDRAPMLLSPLLVYPDPTATLMTIRLRRASGEIFRQDFPLSPAPAEGFAYWISPDLAPFALTAAASSFIIPASLKSPVSLSGVIISARSQAPLVPVDTVTVSARSVVAIVRAVRAAVSWDYNRLRFYTFGHDGIFMLSLTPDGIFSPVHTLDCRPVVSARAVIAATTAGRSALAIAGSDLIAVDGNRTVTLRRSMPACMLARSISAGELWCIGSDGSVTVIADDMSHTYTRTGISVTDVFTDRAFSCITSDDGELYDLSRELAVTMPCQWSVTIDLCRHSSSAAVPRVTGISVAIDSPHINGSLSLSAYSSSGHSSLISSLTVDGPVSRPLMWRVIAPPRRLVTFTFAAHLAPASRLRAVSISLLHH